MEGGVKGWIGGGSGKGAVRKGGSGVMKRGGGSANPRYQLIPHVTKRGKSDVRDVVEGGAPQGGRGRAQSHPSTEQWRSTTERRKKNGLPADHGHGNTHSTQSCPCRGGRWRRLAVNLPAPCCDMTPRRESTVVEAGIRRTALNSGRASCSRCNRSVVHPFLRRPPARTGSLM